MHTYTIPGWEHSMVNTKKRNREKSIKMSNCSLPDNQKDILIISLAVLVSRDVRVI